MRALAFALRRFLKYWLTSLYQRREDPGTVPRSGRNGNLFLSCLCRCIAMVLSMRAIPRVSSSHVCSSVSTADTSLLVMGLRCGLSVSAAAFKTNLGMTIVSRSPALCIDIPSAASYRLLMTPPLPLESFDFDGHIAFGRASVAPIRFSNTGIQLALPPAFSKTLLQPSAETMPICPIVNTPCSSTKPTPILSQTSSNLPVAESFGFTAVMRAPGVSSSVSPSFASGVSATGSAASCMQNPSSWSQRPVNLTLTALRLRNGQKNLIFKA